VGGAASGVAGASAARVKSLAAIDAGGIGRVTRPGTGDDERGDLSGAPLLFNTLGIMPQEMITVSIAGSRGSGGCCVGRGFGGAGGVLAEPGTLAAERARVAAARPTRTPADILQG